MMQALLIFLVSMVLTGCLVKGARHWGWMDIPSSRRTHVIPTPRGGGVAIVLTFMGLSFHLLYLPALFIAVMGFWDDMRNLPARLRLLMQIMAATLGFYLLHGFHPIDILGLSIPAFLWIIGWVWLTNLYNFMDGINGLATMEAIFFCLGMGSLTHFQQPQWGILASASAGFLVWNFPRAKIFLGDVGSQFLGFMLGLILVQQSLNGDAFFFSALILLGVFIVDTGVTLVTRMLLRQNLAEAHRTHAYQKFWQYFQGNHVKATGLLMLINIFWLWPFAWASMHGIISGFYALLISYFPLVIMALIFKAGRAVE